MRFHPRSSVVAFGLGGFIALLFLGALFWALGRDPFARQWFKAHPADGAKAECIAVLPKMAAGPLPVVVYLHGAGGQLLRDGNELRQLAELGLAAVGMDYCQTNEAAFDAQFIALLNYLGRQPWADTNHVAWVGYSLGAQRLLSFTLRHPDLQPRLLAHLAGGWVPELEQFKVRSSQFEVQRSTASAPTLNSAPSTILLIHGERDEVFPLSMARDVAACLQTNGVPVELRVLPRETHSLGDNRLLVFRVIGEQCLMRLKGADALGSYRSILSWQAQARPLWLFWTPALAWAGLWTWWRWGPRWGSRERLPSRAAGGMPAPVRWEIALRVAAAILAMSAVAVTALHVVLPRLNATDWTLGLARKHLVQATEASDFEFLRAQPVWRGKPLKTLLEHVELAHYNRDLIGWKLDEPVYRDFVLSPQIGPAADGELNWRRTLWESFYPRIRKEQDPQAAAEIVVRFLRERVTIFGESGKQKAESTNQGSSASIAEIWRRQVADECGFEAVYVAALRSVGVPARLGPHGGAEFRSGAEWQAAPRPLVER